MTAITAQAVEIYSAQLRAKILNYGATLQDLRLAGHAPSLVLGFDNPSDYQQQLAFVGATVGRFANRIGGASFDLDGTRYNLDANEGVNTLHGGTEGFHQQLWQIADCSHEHVTLEHKSPAGFMGFPGNLRATVRYRIIEDAALEVAYRCTTDSPTVCALSHHSYFNLDDGGRTPIDEHKIEIAANEYTEVDPSDIPTGETDKVASLDHDFSTMQRLGDTKCDLNFCLADQAGEMKVAAKVRGRSGIRLDVLTDQPGLQFYTADYPQDFPIGHDGIVYHPRSGFCLEAQCWPDAPNHADFPSAVLRPDEVYESTTVYRFSF
ncbi:MAG: aldose epimerase family protein [Pseudomonadota bacterium]